MMVIRAAGKQSSLEQFAEERQMYLSELVEQIGACLYGARDKLAALGFDRTETLEDWEHLARIVERDPGPMTLDDIYHAALAWVDRQKIRLKLASEVKDTRAPVPAKCTADKYDIRPDPLDPRAVLCMGKRVYLGGDTQVRRLFWLFVSPLGRPVHMSELQRAVDGMETSEAHGHKKDDIRLANQRVRKALSDLRRLLAENFGDRNFLIVPGGNRWDREYTMVYRWAGDIKTAPDLSDSDT